MIDKYLAATWKRDGMAWPYLNCWGLVRLASKELFGRTLQPIDCDVYDKRATTKACHEIITKPMRVTAAESGAIAVVWRGKLCIHVGLVVTVDDKLAVLDIDEGVPPRVSWIADFERRYLRVEYYA
tara:strand:+ start:31 stop:408 length:378 start_codon:yes stop_codon:yes gene_type:complete